MNGFPELNVERVYVKFGDPSCNSFWDIVWNRQTYARQWKPFPVIAVRVGKKCGMWIC